MGLDSVFFPGSTSARESHMNLVRTIRSLPCSASAACLGLAMLASPATSQTAPSEKKVDPQINAQFQKGDVQGFVQRFESHDREVFAHRDEVVAALNLKPGAAVADVGAGTGLFTRLIAEKVGAEGRVYAVDVSRDFLKHIAKQSQKLGQSQVQTVLGAQDETKLKPASVDLVFICDVYHHFEEPEKVLASIHQALRPGGSLVLIEFDRVEGKSSDFVLKHVRAGKGQFIQEIENAGFTRDETGPKPKLKENFFARFRKNDESKPESKDSSD